MWIHCLFVHVLVSVLSTDREVGLRILRTISETTILRKKAILLAVKVKKKRHINLLMLLNFLRSMIKRGRSSATTGVSELPCSHHIHGGITKERPYWTT